MKRATLCAAVAVCTLNLTLSPRFGVAATKTSESRAQRAIAIEVLIVRAHKDIEEDHSFECSGPSEEVAARVRELQSEGRIDVVDRIRLTTVEDQKAQFQAGRVAPVVSGRSFAGRGVSPQRSQLSYQQKNLGTLITAVARVDGNAIVVELQVEKSQLERRAGSPKPDDEFVPLATETLTTQATVRIRSGKTVLAGSLETRADTKSSEQLILASARLLEPALRAEDVAPTQSATKRQIRIFSLQHTDAEAAAAIIKELSDDDSEQIKVAVDSRSNSLIVAAEKVYQLVAIEAILLRLDERVSRRGPRSPKNAEKVDATPEKAKYDRLGKKNLQAELRRLQGKVLEAEGAVRRARRETTEAEKAHKAAGDDEKADALLRVLEAKAASRKPNERFRRIRWEFEAAQQAYLNRLLTE
jgi:type II secretory pathway component GspD/PulD (secretin)